MHACKINKYLRLCNHSHSYAHFSGPAISLPRQMARKILMHVPHPGVRHGCVCNIFATLCGRDLPSCKQLHQVVIFQYKSRPNGSFLSFAIPKRTSKQFCSAMAFYISCFFSIDKYLLNIVPEHAWIPRGI